MHHGLLMFEAAKRLLVGDSHYYNLPSSHWFDFARDNAKYSPDIAKLEEYDFQLFFACDETQTKHVKHNLIEDGSYICPAFSQKGFNYWQPEAPFLPPVPMAAENYSNPMGNMPPVAKIKGQLHAIRPYQFLLLDNYKENGVQFRRERIRLLVPFRSVEFLKDRYNLPERIERISEEGGKTIGITKEAIVIIRAWMYIGVPEYWDKLISAFDYKSVQTYTAKNRRWCHEYYQLRK